MQMLLTMFVCPTHHLGVEQGHYSQALPVTAWDLVRRIPLSWALTSHTVGERETLFGMLDFFSNSSVSNNSTITAPPAAQIIINGLPATALPVQIVFAKFGMHLPLHRQSKDFARLECEIAKSTMCGWHIRFAAFLCPVLKALEKTGAREQPRLLR